MNITLSADQRLIEEAREKAASEGTTLNEVIRRYMERYVGGMTPAEVAAEFERTALEGGGRSQPGWKFSREETHRRDFGK